jgi:hypothetical protein
MFDPNRKPRVPGGLENGLRERENYFDPKIGEDEGGFTLQEAESLGWTVDLLQGWCQLSPRLRWLSGAI